MNRAPISLPQAILPALAALLLINPASAAPYTLVNALREWHDLSLLQRPADPPRRFAQLSSWDRNLANFDQGNFLREENGEMVLMDVHGPGVLTRLWTAEPMGVLRFYWDGAEEPQLTVSWQDLQKYGVTPLEEPFVTSSGGGCVMRFPLPFREGLKVTLAEQTWPHWQIHYHYFPPDTEVTSWWPAMGPPPGAPQEFTAAEEAWLDPASAPVPGEVLWNRPVALSHADRRAEYSPESPIIVTGIAVRQSVGEVIPGELRFLLEAAEGETIDVPWRGLSGVWDAEGDSASLLQGRQAGTSWFRVPFLVTPDDRISFLWVGDDLEEEFVGEITLRGIPVSDEDPHPRLSIRADRQTVGMGTRYVAEPFEGNGRLLAVTTRVSATGNAYFMEGDELIYLEGESFASIRGTGMEDLFDSAWYFMNDEFATAASAAPLLAPDRMEASARTSWWPLGIPFVRSLRFELEGGALDDAPPTDHDLILVGQRFSAAEEVPPPGSETVTHLLSDFGRRVTTCVDDMGFPVYTESAAPVMMRSLPHTGWLEPGAVVEGAAQIEVRGGDVRHVAMRLDLPFGWSGELGGMDETREVYDIGWPPIERWDPEAGIYEFEWTARPPRTLFPGDHIVQLRTEVETAEGHRYTIRHPVRLYGTPDTEPYYEWAREDMKEAGPHELQFSLPEDFTPQPGDMIALRARANHRIGKEQGAIHLRFHPVGAVPNLEGQFEEVEPLISSDGHAEGRLLFGGKEHQIVFRVGRYNSWMGSPRDLIVYLEAYAETADIEIIGARLLRHPPYPTPEVQARRIPYRETELGRFLPPEGMVAIIEGEELRGSTRRVVSTPQNHLTMEWRPTEYLENVEAGPIKWWLARPPYRFGHRPPARGMLFPARFTGERIRIADERIQGSRRFGIQFGYGPWCGTVGIRDCEGRLVGVHELYMNKQATFPHFLEVNLPVPSRDPWFYLEALAPAPGSFEVRIPVFKVILLEDHQTAAGQ